MEEKIKIPVSLRLAARVMEVDAAELAECLLEAVTGPEAWQVARVLRKMLKKVQVEAKV